MIINPIIAAAAVAARAVGTIFPGDWMERRTDYYQEWHDEPPYRDATHSMDRQYYNMDMEERLHDQGREFHAFVTTTNSPVFVQDAEILSKETTTNHGSSNRPPPLLNTNNPWKLLGLETGASFDEIRKAYKEMVKIYHPDVVVGPDASADERREANDDFARINAAFQFHKRKASEKVYEYSMYIDGKQVTRSVVMSDEHQYNDPYRIDYDRLREMSEHRKRRPKTTMWHEAENDYQQRHNGFQSYSVDAYSKGQWCHTSGARHDVTGRIISTEQNWGNRMTAEQQESMRSDFGFSPVQDHWGDERSSYDVSKHNQEYQSRNINKFRSTEKQPYPYKDRLWNESYSTEAPRRPTKTVDVNDDDQRSYLPMDKWWKGDETAFGDFSP